MTRSKSFYLGSFIYGTEIFYQHLQANIFRDFLHNRILIWSYSTNLLHQLGTYYSINKWFHRMPVIVAGGDSQSASQRDLAVFSLCSLIDKRDASKSQLNTIAFSIFCSLMAAWGLNVSLGAACILLCISIAFALYALYTEADSEGIVVPSARYTAKWHWRIL